MTMNKNKKQEQKEPSPSVHVMSYNLACTYTWSAVPLNGSKKYFVINCPSVAISFLTKFFVMFSIFSYDTAVEQVSVIKQLTELFIVQEDEFQYGSAMLDLAIALDSLVDVDLGEDK